MAASSVRLNRDRKLAFGTQQNTLKSMGGYKNLAEGRSDWSFKNREDFGELLFVTTTSRKSIYGNSRNPGADCCVRFLTKGIQMLSVSSFEKVLGPKDAREEIMKVCERDGICAPWAVEMITEDNDPKGGKWRKKQSKLPSSKANEIEKGSRVDGLERKLADMTEKVDSLVQLMAKLLQDRPEEE
ncbi:hypothetical protein V8F06_014397 [Rhypophila decipiens]